MGPEPFQKPIAKGIFLAGLLLMAASLPLSKVGMSLGQFVMALGWFWEGRFLQRLKILVNSKIALLLISFYLLHVLGLLWTDDMQWAMKDLRIKLPIFVLPILFVTGPRFKRQELYWVLGIFLAAVFSGSLISTGKALFTDVVDARDLSPYISHIRFSLIVCLAIALTVVFAMSVKAGKYKLFLIILAIWLFLFLFILRAFTGFLVFSIVTYLAVAHAIVHAKGKKNKQKWSLVFAVLLIIGGGAYLSLHNKIIKKEKIDVDNLDLYTANSGVYSHDTLNLQTVNGNYVWFYICEYELEEAWEERSSMPYDHVYEDGRIMKHLMIRYMTSLGYRKDASGIQRLTDEDIQKIESGSAYAGDGIPSQILERINDIFWSIDHYRQTGEAEGNSLTQRLELWKTGWSLFWKSPVLGTGTGDIRNEFAKELELNDSSLTGSPLRAHNQMLSLAIAFGIPGLLWILISLFWPYIHLRKWDSPMYTLFLLIIIVSMFTEDTFETQTGATFFAFFNAFFLFYKADPFEKDSIDDEFRNSDL